MQVEDISVTVLRSGQVGAYKDSITKYQIKSTLPVEEVHKYCTTVLYACSNRCQDAHQFMGSCGFPFGLNCFYRFIETAKGEYEYTVCSPYCD